MGNLIVGNAEKRLETIEFPLPVAATSRPAAAGRCSVRVRLGAGVGVLALLDRVTVSCDSTNRTQCSLYEDDESAGALLDVTENGNKDVADNTQPVTVSADSILVVWTGASDGSIGTVRIQYRRARVVG